MACETICTFFYVFYVFFKIQKTWLFTFFLSCCTRFPEQWPNVVMTRSNSAAKPTKGRRRTLKVSCRRWTDEWFSQDLHESWDRVTGGGEGVGFRSVQTTWSKRPHKFRGHTFWEVFFLILDIFLASPCVADIARPRTMMVCRAAFTNLSLPDIAELRRTTTKQERKSHYVISFKRMWKYST